MEQLIISIIVSTLLTIILIKPVKKQKIKKAIMRKLNLVGQTFQLSTRNKEQGGVITETRRVLSEFSEGKKRFYKVINPSNGQEFIADADVYDQLFMHKRQAFKNKLTKGDACYNPASIHYKFKN